jgi:molybdopterin-containing oxidoreductase family membrane subunit
VRAAGALHRIDEAVGAAHARPGAAYWLALAFSGAVAAFGAWAYSLLFRGGLHWTGLQRPVGWGTLIASFVFWIGIAHAGTLVSAVLFLFRARFRVAIHRVAELMTVLAVLTAGLFPILHLGRPWLAYWLVPYPNARQLTVNFRSPLLWDLFAVSTYLAVSVAFLLVGLVPDAAALRGRTSGWRRRFYRCLALGWQGTGEQWRHHARAYVLLAAFVTPLVVSVHSVVSWDFAVSLVPGWHSSLFPPYFVAGAILSGLAMVLTILVPLRSAFHVEDLVTGRHLDLLARLVVLTAAIVGICHATEVATGLAAPAGDPERAVVLFRLAGPRAAIFWLVLAFACGGPALLFLRRVRGSPPALLVISVAVNVGMWLERFNIVTSSLSHDRLPFLWRAYTPTWVEWAIAAGALGWFLFLFLVAIKVLPPLAVAELKEQAAQDGAAPLPPEALHA